MTIDEVKNLHNIKSSTLSDNHVIYRYAHSIPTGINRKRYLLCIADSILIPRYRLYDYSELSTKLLNKDDLSYFDTSNYFENNKKYHFIDELSLDRAQQIIDNNNYLFAKITNLIKENEIINQINQF